MGKMKVARKVILLFDGGDGLGTSIFESLQPKTDSKFQILNEDFEFSLERYGIKDQKSSGKIIHHVNSNGFLESSILLLPAYEPPISACAVYELLSNLAGDDVSSVPTIVAPFLVPDLKLKTENYSLNSDKKSVYAIKLGPTTDVTQAISSKFLHLPSSSLQTHKEGLALFLQLVSVMKIPSVVVIGRSRQQSIRKTFVEDHQVIHEIGEQLASTLSLEFSKGKIMHSKTKIQRDSEEAWRALYG